MKILVTGGSGLMGYALQQVSKNSENEFIFLSSSDCDLSSYSQTLECFLKIQPDRVIHLAANVGGLFKNMNQKVEMFEKNLLINYNVLKCCHLLKVKKVISCLSTCVFPDKVTYPIDEKMLHQGPPHWSNDAYAYAKRMLEVHSRAYREQYGDNFICVIPTNIYGPNDNFNLEDAHVIPALIHKFYLASQNNQEVTVAGTGKPLRQFLYSFDFARILLWMLDHYEDTQSLIVAPEEEISIGELTQLIAKKYDLSKERIYFNTIQSDGQYRKTASTQKLQSLLKFEFTPIEEGLSNTIDWFVQNYNRARK